MFSSIEEEERIVVINKCYCPPVEIAENGIPIAIEASVLTLEIIHNLNPEFGSRGSYCHPDR